MDHIAREKPPSSELAKGRKFSKKLAGFGTSCDLKQQSCKPVYIPTLHLDVSKRHSMLQWQMRRFVKKLHDRDIYNCHATTALADHGFLT